MVDARDLLARVERRWPEEKGWWVFPEVTLPGPDGRDRRADALVMAAWPSKGFELHGVEIKVSRGDVLRELREPAKSHAIQRYCNRFWLVVSDKNLVTKDELPDDWGLLVPHGETLRAAKKPKKLKPQPWPRAVTAAMIRSLRRGEHDGDHREYRRGWEAGHKSAESLAGGTAESLKNCQATLSRFHEITGLHLSKWTLDGGVEDVAKRFKALREVKVDRAVTVARGMADQLEAVVAKLRAAVQTADLLDSPHGDPQPPR